MILLQGISAKFNASVNGKNRLDGRQPFFGCFGELTLEIPTTKAASTPLKR